MSTEGKDDLTVMFPPECFVMVGTEKVVLREYGFIEEMELRPHSQPFINDLMLLIGGVDVTLAAVDALVVKHIQSVQVMIAASADKTVEWLRGLNKEDGAQVYRAWWEANGPFFMRCATECLRSELVTKALAGLTLPQRSSPADTNQIELENTPTAK